MTPAAFVRDAFRRLPDLRDLLAPYVEALDAGEQAICIAECAAREMTDWAQDAIWEPDWDTVFDLLDLWSDALATLGETDELVNIVMANLGCLNVPARRYGEAALARATPDFRQRMLDAPALVSLASSLPSHE